MSSQPSDQADRDRFTHDWGVNLAVVANAGSGKTTAIAKRLAAMARSASGAEMLVKTAVVTYTKKAADQIGQRARREVLQQMTGEGATDMSPLARLDKAFFGTIHSFCIVLARTHGSELGVHLNPKVIEEDDLAWEAFVEQDPMQFGALTTLQMDAFLRHASLDDVFKLAREVNPRSERWLAQARIPESPPAPAPAALEAILNASARKGAASLALERNKETARDWVRRFKAESGSLPIPRPAGSAASIVELYNRLFAPLKDWVAAAGGVLAAELSMRYRAWRQDQGIQTYSDQVETALAVLSNPFMLEQIRGEGWRVILDEAQDTDPSQFSVLVEITRPPGSALEAWPGSGGEGPRPGHFCMVGDAQQGIYGDRADIRNFQRHVAAFERGDGGERLTFAVTFRAPRRVVRLLNETLPRAFGPERPYNLGLPSAEGAPARLLQVEYAPLVPGPSNIEGGAWLLPIAPAEVAGKQKVADRRLADEARQVAQFLSSGGPASLGAGVLGDICILAPRREWLRIIRGELEAAGLKTALQMKRNRNGDNPVYAWICGLLAVACDPEDQFEWVGVLREVFAVSDSELAAAMRDSRRIRWDEPGDHPGPIEAALVILAPFIGRVDSEGEALGSFAADLAGACGLAGKARMADPDGGLQDELARLLAQADELGMAGAGPRAWLRALLGSIDEFRASGRPAPDAINMMTSHSAKGLEWPVVIPVGLWRKIGSPKQGGLRIISERDGVARVVLDNSSLGEEARDSRERERLRELVRLMYVTLTRSRAALVVPWAGAEQVEDNSFLGLWDMDPARLDALPAPGPLLPEPAGVPGGHGGRGAEGADAGGVGQDPAPAAAAPAFPLRILPHELAQAPDLPRAARHEASLDEASPVRDAADPLDYGVWWHEALESVPWKGDRAAVSAHASASVANAGEKGFQARAGQEWERLLASEPWRLMRDSRWTALAEVGIFAPLDPGRWIDGVIDLVLHDPAAREVWIVDWKTNRGRDGEDDPSLLARLATEYRGQLGAYGACAAGFFPGCAVRLWLYSTVAGAWKEVPGCG